MAREKKPKNDRVLKEHYKCYDCGGTIANLKDLVKKDVVLVVSPLKLITRTFHLKCLINWNERALDMDLIKEESTDWDKVYQYFKNEYLKLSDWKEMQGHPVNRLLGLRLGQYSPRGSNVKILKRGYSYDTIYKAMVVAKPKAMIMASEMNFANMKHKVDFFMKFIASEVEDVQLRIDKMKKVNESTEKASIKNKNVVVEDHIKSYADMVKRQEEKKDNVDKALDIINGWGVELDDEE